MVTLYTLSQDDIKVLKDVVEREKKLLRNVPNRTATVQPIPQASDSYIVQVIEENGLLPGATLTCPVYKRIRLAGVDSLNYAGFTIDVYNPSSTVIPLNAIFLTTKDKYGTWVPAISGLAEILVSNTQTTVYCNGELIGTEPSINFINCGEVFAVATDDPENSIVNVEFCLGGTGTGTGTGSGGDIPDATPLIRGLVNTTTQSFGGAKTFEKTFFDSPNLNILSGSIDTLTTTLWNIDFFGLVANQQIFDENSTLRAFAQLTTTSYLSGQATFLIQEWDEDGNAIDAAYAVTDNSGTQVGQYGSQFGIVFCGGLFVGTNSVPTTLAGFGITDFRLLFDHFVDVGNSTTTETDLYSDTISAGKLAGNGDKLETTYGGIFVSSATATRQIKIYFGGSVILDTGTLTLSLSSAWTVYASIIRVDSSTIRYSISFTTEGAALAAYTAVGEVTGLTLSSTNILKITGQAAGVGAATNDIVAKMGYVEYKQHA